MDTDQAKVDAAVAEAARRDPDPFDGRVLIDVALLRERAAWIERMALVRSEALLAAERERRAEDGKTVMARDQCVVDSEPLARLLRPFIDTWARERPQVGGRFAAKGGREEIAIVSAVEWISSETYRIAAETPEAVGVPVGTIEGLTARDRRTGELRPRSKKTELRIADALVTAIGRSDAFYNGTLNVHARPGNSGAACCGGTQVEFAPWSLDERR